jgi:hypothetical protein
MYRDVSLLQQVEGSGHGQFLIYSLFPATVQRNNLKSRKQITGSRFEAITSTV